RVENWRDVSLLDALRQRHAAFDGFSLVECQAHFFLQQRRVLVSTERRIARENRSHTIQDVDVGRGRADVQQCYNMTWLWVVIKLVAILQRECVDIDDRRLFARELNRLL